MKSALSFPSRSAFRVVLSMVAASTLPQVQADTLAVADTTSHVVRRYDATTGASLGVFASGAGLTLPYGLAFGPDGNLYVANYSPGSVLRYNGSTGAFIDAFATASSYAAALAFGPDGHLYVGLNNGNIERFDGTTGTSLGMFTPTTIGPCSGLTFQGGSLFATYLGTSTADGGRLRQYNATTGAYITTLHSAFNANGPRAPRFGPDGNLYVPDWQTYHVAKFDGATLAYQGNIINDPAHPFPIALAFGSDGTLLVLEDNGIASSVNRYNLATGAFIGQLVAPGSGGLGRANSLLLRPSAPRLAVQDVQGGGALWTTMTLTWTNNGSLCVLESAAAATGPWDQETTTWSTNANWVSTPVTSTNSVHFYRLKSNW